MQPFKEPHVANNVRQFPSGDIIGDGTRLEVDAALQAAIGNLKSVVVIGYDKEGCEYVATDGSSDAALAIILRAQHTILDCGS